MFQKTSLSFTTLYLLNRCFPDLILLFIFHSSSYSRIPAFQNFGPPLCMFTPVKS